MSENIIKIFENHQIRFLRKSKEMLLKDFDISFKMDGGLFLKILKYLSSVNEEIPFKFYQKKILIQMSSLGKKVHTEVEIRDDVLMSYDAGINESNPDKYKLAYIPMKGMASEIKPFAKKSEPITVKIDTLNKMRAEFIIGDCVGDGKGNIWVILLNPKSFDEENLIEFTKTIHEIRNDPNIESAKMVMRHESFSRICKIKSKIKPKIKSQTEQEGELQIESENESETELKIESEVELESEKETESIKDLEYKIVFDVDKTNGLVVSAGNALNGVLFHLQFGQVNAVSLTDYIEMKLQELRKIKLLTESKLGDNGNNSKYNMSRRKRPITNVKKDDGLLALTMEQPQSVLVSLKDLILLDRIQLEDDIIMEIRTGRFVYMKTYYSKIKIVFVTNAYEV